MNRKSCLVSHFIIKEGKDSNWLLKQKMKGSVTKTSHFFFLKKQLFFRMLLLSPFDSIWTPLWIPRQPCSGKKKKKTEEKKKKEKNCFVFCFVLHTVSTVWNLLHPSIIKHRKLKKKVQSNLSFCFTFAIHLSSVIRT